MPKEGDPFFAVCLRVDGCVDVWRGSVPQQHVAVVASASVWSPHAARSRMMKMGL